MSPAIKWMVAIGGLLAANVIATVILAVSANRGPSQVIPEYYERAVHYDDAIDRSTASDALGWHASTVVSDRLIEVTVRDGRGLPLDGARVHVTGYQRAYLADAIQLELVATGDGHYRAVPRLDRGGAYDLTVMVERGRDHYTRLDALEVR